MSVLAKAVASEWGLFGEGDETLAAAFRVNVAIDRERFAKLLRVRELVRPLDLVELGIVADHLDSAGRFGDSARVRAAMDAIAAVGVVLKGVKP